MTDLLHLTCSDFSQQAGEQLFGTASQVETWFLLEYEGRWEPDILNSDLPAPAKTWLAEQLAAVPKSRAQFIRQKPRLAPDGIAFFVVLSHETNPVIYEFHLASYDDLLALDIAGLRAENPIYNPSRRTEPLFLVCTHGRRDRCCAQRGVPVVDALGPELGAAVWQTSHVGGHRFAANLVCFPHGIYNGHVTPETALGIVAAYRDGQIVPAHYRGRSCYPGIAQAAEYFLRAATGVTGLNTFRLAGVTPELDPQHPDQSGNRHRVSFVADGATVHGLVLVAEPGLNVYSSCDDAAPSPVEQFRLEAHHRTES